MSSPTNNTSTIDLRKKLAKEYCRSVLWLDDEIKFDATDGQREKFLRFFARIADEFSKKHVLCQLKGFPQIKEGDDPYADSLAVNDCAELAKRTDVLILDWHLGATSPVHSKKILGELIKEGGNRFIVLLSKEPQLRLEFEKEFSDVFRLEGEWYRHDEGPFVLLLQKTSFETAGSGTALIDKIYDQLALSYPDYLHWAAIEVVGRIKALAHSWLSRLPINTDVAILAEKVHSGESIEEAILENLLDDLKETVTLEAVSSLGPQCLAPGQWLKREKCQERIEQDLKAIADRGQQTSFQNLHPLTAKGALDAKDRSTFKGVTEKQGHLPSIKELRDSVEALGQFSEVVSVPRTAKSILRPGSILLEKGATGAQRIVVCISQGCDCIRAKSLLFLQGTETPSVAGEAGETFLQFNGKRYLFKPRAENLLSQTLEVDRTTIQGWIHVGLLRQQTLTRLISRFWNYSTRVGVNQPRFVRDSRKEAAL
jgi:hypothetical protein